MNASACSILSRVSISGFSTVLLTSFWGTEEVKKLTDMTAATFSFSSKGTPKVVIRVGSVRGSRMAYPALRARFKY